MLKGYGLKESLERESNRLLFNILYAITKPHHGAYLRFVAEEVLFACLAFQRPSKLSARAAAIAPLEPLKGTSAWT